MLVGKKVDLVDYSSLDIVITTIFTKVFSTDKWLMCKFKN